MIQIEPRRGTSVPLSPVGLPLCLLVGLLGVGTAGPLRAEPGVVAPALSELIARAKDHAPSAKVSAAVERQRAYDAQTAWLRLAPRVQASAGYKRNDPVVEFEVPAAPGEDKEVLTFTPLDQLDASVQLEVPLLHWRAFATVLEASHNAESARLAAIADELSLERRVASAYHQWIGAEAFAQANARALEAAETQRTVAWARADAGTATSLERASATAEVERARARAADADEQRATARRRLSMLVGVDVPGVPSLDDEALGAEAPLQQWLVDASTLPGVASAIAARDAAGARALGVWSALAPDVTGVVAERLTNANGFAPIDTFYAGVSVSWTLDPSVVPRALAAQAATAEADARQQEALDAAREAIEEAWLRVLARGTKLVAARGTLRATTEAAAAARERYEAGSLSLLDVVRADRDVLLANAEVIQAELDVRQARVDLRIAAGRSLLDAPLPGGAA